MTSSQPGALQTSGKSLNISSSHSPIQQQQQQQAQLTSPAFESGGRRSGGSSNLNFSSARNNQVSRKQHRNQRKPRLGDEDAIAESVRAPAYVMMYTVLNLNSVQ